jgi:hypothetical protein
MYLARPPCLGKRVRVPSIRVPPGQNGNHRFGRAQTVARWRGYPVQVRIRGIGPLKQRGGAASVAGPPEGPGARSAYRYRSLGLQGVVLKSRYVKSLAVAALGVLPAVAQARRSRPNDEPCSDDAIKPHVAHKNSKQPLAKNHAFEPATPFANPSCFAITASSILAGRSLGRVQFLKRSLMTA